MKINKVTHFTYVIEILIINEVGIMNCDKNKSAYLHKISKIVTKIFKIFIFGKCLLNSTQVL